MGAAYTAPGVAVSSPSRSSRAVFVPEARASPTFPTQQLGDTLESHVLKRRRPRQVPIACRRGSRWDAKTAAGLSLTARNVPRSSRLSGQGHVGNGDDHLALSAERLYPVVFALALSRPSGHYTAESDQVPVVEAKLVKVVRIEPADDDRIRAPLGQAKRDAAVSGGDSPSESSVIRRALRLGLDSLERERAQK